jgi:histidinol-phosphate aminotransferase
LDKNENTDPAMIDLVSRLVRDTPTSYATAYPDCFPLYDALASWLQVDIEQLLLGAGADGLIRSVFEAFVAPRDHILFATPTYAMYEVYARMFGARIASVQYRYSDEGLFFDMCEFVAMARNHPPRVICVSNPNSPTGTVLSRNEIVAIAKTACEVGSVFLIDEAYYPFHAESGVGLIDQYDNIIVIRSFSKAWGLAGLRVGYGIGSQRLVEMLHRVRSSYEVDHFAASVATGLLAYVNEMHDSVNRLIAGREWFNERLRLLGLDVPQTATNFSLVDFGDGADTVREALDGLVKYRNRFEHSAMQNLCRFTSATVEQLEPVVERIALVYE